MKFKDKVEKEVEEKWDAELRMAIKLGMKIFAIRNIERSWLPLSNIDIQQKGRCSQLLPFSLPLLLLSHVPSLIFLIKVCQ